MNISISTLDKYIDKASDALEKLSKEDISSTNLKEGTDVACLLLKLLEIKKEVPMMESPMYSNTGVMPMPYSGNNSYGYSDGMVVRPFEMGRSYGYPVSYAPAQSYAMPGYPEQRMPNAYMDRPMNEMSRHSIGDRAVAALESMMDQAPTDFERKELKEYIKAIRREQM